MADIVCPLCGKTYEGLNLDETNGWFICTKYDIYLCLPGYGKKVKIPLVNFSKNKEANQSQR